MTFSEAIIGRDFENQAWWRSTCSLRKATCSSIRKPHETSGRPDKYVEPCPGSEATGLALDDPVRELVDVLELRVDYALRVLLDRLEVRALLLDDLRGRGLRVIDRLADLGHNPHPDLFHLPGVLPHDPVRDVEREDVVQLAHMGHGILPGRGLHGHRPIRRDEATDPVSAADAPIVAILPRQARHGQVEN